VSVEESKEENQEKYNENQVQLLKKLVENTKNKEETDKNIDNLHEEESDLSKSLKQIEVIRKEDFNFQLSDNDKPMYLQSPNNKGKDYEEDLSELHSRSDVKNEEDQNSDTDSLKPIQKQENKNVNRSDEIEPLGKGNEESLRKEDSGETVKMNERQTEILEIVKSCLKDKEVTLAEMIEDEIVIGKNEDQKEYEIIMEPELMSILTNLCNKKVSNEDLKELLKIVVETESNYIVMQNLLELFGESNTPKDDYEIEDEEIIEDIKNLDTDSINLITNLINYLEENNMSITDMMRDIIYQQTAAVGNEVLDVNVINADEFYTILKEHNLSNTPQDKISELLCITSEYPDIFLVKKLVKVLEHMKNNATNEPIQEDSEEGKCLNNPIEISEKDIE